jgi:hypothetical protein
MDVKVKNMSGSDVFMKFDVGIEDDSQCLDITIFSANEFQRHSGDECPILASLLFNPIFFLF